MSRNSEYKDKITPLQIKKKRQEKREGEEIKKYKFDDIPVNNTIGIDDNSITIYSWCLDDKDKDKGKGKGHTVKALNILQSLNKKIIINSIGESPCDESWKYWLHMRSKGLVDILEDDQGDQVPF